MTRGAPGGPAGCSGRAKSAAVCAGARAEPSALQGPARPCEWLGFLPGAKPPEAFKQRNDEICCESRKVDLTAAQEAKVGAGDGYDQVHDWTPCTSTPGLGRRGHRASLAQSERAGAQGPRKRAFS